MIDRWKAPTPKFFRKVIRVSLTAAAGAGALLMAEPLGSAIIPGFTFKLLPVVELICKNIVVAGLVSAAISKFAKDDSDKEKEN